MYHSTKMKSEHVHPHVIDSPNLPHDIRVKVTLVTKPLLMSVTQMLCKCIHDVFTSRVFILKHYFATKSYAAFHEAFSNEYPDKEVPNKTTIHQLVTKCWDTGSTEHC
jgi:hypothetical protein